MEKILKLRMRTQTEVGLSGELFYRQSSRGANGSIDAIQ